MMIGAARATLRKGQPVLRNLTYPRTTAVRYLSSLHHLNSSQPEACSQRPEDVASVSTYTTSEIRPTRVAVFSSQRFERDFINNNTAILTKLPGLTLEYFVPRLTPGTAHMANGADAVCAFVNDVLDRKALTTLAANGTNCVLMRCAGHNNVDLEAAEELNISVMNVPKYSPHAVAEFAVSLLMTVVRKTHKAYNRVRESNFSLSGLMGSDFHGKTVGVIGTGKIGRIFCRIMGQGFGCRVVAYDRRESDEAKALGVEYVSKEELLRESDIVALHCPLTPETHHMIDAEAIEQMKPGVVLINTSRGGLVNMHDLIDGLRSKRIGACGFDVVEGEDSLFFEDHSGEILEDETVAELLTFPNVLMTPHLAFCTETAMANIWTTTVGNMKEYLDVRDGVSDDESGLTHGVAG